MILLRESWKDLLVRAVQQTTDAVAFARAWLSWEPHAGQQWSDSRTNGRRSIETDVRCAECGRYLTARTVRRGMTICWACYKRRLGKRPYKKKGGEGSKSSSKAGPPRP